MKAQTFSGCGDMCLGFFEQAWHAQACPLATGARVLELGCAEADWLAEMRRIRPDLHLTGIDWRDQARPAANRQIQEDILTTHAFDGETFDAIVAVSVVGWIGNGNYVGKGNERDPLCTQGDVRLLERIRQWLAPGGWFYFDVPTNPPRTPQRPVLLRGYGPAELATLLTGWRICWQKAFPDALHCDGPYIAQVITPA